MISYVDPIFINNMGIQLIHVDEVAFKIITEDIFIEYDNNGSHYGTRKIAWTGDWIKVPALREVKNPGYVVPVNDKTKVTIETYTGETLSFIPEWKEDGFTVPHYYGKQEKENIQSLFISYLHRRY